MDHRDITLCTFTYNDQRLVDGLVANLADWTLAPGAILVTDDGSDPPFDPAGLPASARVLRLPENLGITKAKHTGVSSAATDLILAMDCDVRLAPRWVELALPHVLRPEVGAVCGPVVHAPGTDSVTKFLRAFGDNHNTSASGPVEFMPGNAYLIRREVWERVGGFGDYGRNVCEDHYLSSKIRAAGLSIWCEPAARAVQVRRISRLAMVKRFWKWCHKPVKGGLPESAGFADFLTLTFVGPMVDRLGTAAETGEPAFVYLELLYLSHIVLDLLDFATTSLAYDAGLARAWAAGLSELVGPRRRLAALLQADLAGLGHHVSLVPGDPAPFGEVFAIFTALAQTGVYDWLDSQGAAMLLAEDASGDQDFSFYRHAAHDAGETA